MLIPVVIHCLFHGSDYSVRVQLCPEAATILQFCVTLRTVKPVVTPLIYSEIKFSMFSKFSHFLESMRQL